ncbi:hypothetical protein ABH941_006591 [Streptacidiphilus sp. EB103A]
MPRPRPPSPGLRPEGRRFAPATGAGGGGAPARSVSRWAGVALHGCNGSVWWGVLGAVSRARARTEAASPRDKGRGWGRSGAERLAVGGGGAPRLQRQRWVGRVARRFPGSRPDRSGFAARQGPGAAWARRGALAGGAGRGECVPQSGYLGGVATRLGGVATIYGCNSPQCGCNSPQHGQSGPKKGFCRPTRRRATRQRTPHRPPPRRGCREAEPSHLSPGPTIVPHGGDGRSAGASAHRSLGRWKGARSQTYPAAPTGAAPPPPTQRPPPPPPILPPLTENIRAWRFRPPAERRTVSWNLTNRQYGSCGGEGRGRGREKWREAGGGGSCAAPSACLAGRFCWAVWERCCFCPGGPGGPRRPRSAGRMP